MQDIYEVFSGSSVDASFIKSYLKDNGIGVIIRNLHQSSINAGWINPLSDKGVSVMVSSENFEKAERLVREYLESREQL